MRAERFGIDHFAAVGYNPKEAENRALVDEVLAGIGEYADHERCVAWGEIGLNNITENEIYAFRTQQRGGLAPARLGVCLDTCHAAVNFEDPRAELSTLRDAGVRVPKVQLSSAFDVRCAAEARPPSAEGTYLHQTRVRSEDGHVTRYTDLPEALADAPDGRWRFHFHVPLHYE